MDDTEMKDRGLDEQMVTPSGEGAAPGNFTDQNADAPIVEAPSGEAAVESGI